jgi:aminocarboxymuconate-semialdehyde decarboxylase
MRYPVARRERGTYLRSIGRRRYAFTRRGRAEGAEELMSRHGRNGSDTVDRRDFIRLSAGLGAVMLADPAAIQRTPQTAEVRTAAIAAGSIDAHAHWVPQAYADALALLGRPTTSIHTALELDANLNRRIAWMDEHGIKMHVLTLDGGMPWQWVSPADAARLARIVNDAAVEAHVQYPDRFIAGVELPVRQPELALQELNRMAGKPGIRAVHLPNSMENGDFLFDAAYDPLWARCQELGYPILFHPLDGPDNIYGGTERLGNPLALSTNLNNTLGFAFESATTAAKFIITGTLDRFPTLQVVLPHSGGCFPYVAGRIERGLTAKKFELRRPFREYIRRFHYDSITYYPETLRFLVSLVGTDRIVIGSDGYAPMDVAEPNALVRQLDLAPIDRDRILRGNAMRLFRL